jgi:FtsP/CotA-like multicopper oxidase with cupredoxin domain
MSLVSRNGSTDVTNPGPLMVHCHIAAHHESGMMLSLDVAPGEQASA